MRGLPASELGDSGRNRVWNENESENMDGREI